MKLVEKFGGCTPVIDAPRGLFVRGGRLYLKAEGGDIYDCDTGDLVERFCYTRCTVIPVEYDGGQP